MPPEKVKVKLPPFKRAPSFENFFVDKTNSFAVNLARAVAEETFQGEILFLFGGCGVGKTHLLSAIHRSWRKQHPDEHRTCFLTATKFTDLYVDAAFERNGADLRKFRESLRQAKLFLVDEVSFLAGKKKTQEVFASVLDELLLRRVPIVCASNVLPKDMKLTDTRLLSRLQKSSIVEISSLQTETRLGILNRLIENCQEDSLWSQSVRELVCGRMNGDARALVGVFQILSAFARFSNVPLSLEFTQESIGRYVEVEDSFGPLSLESIEKAVEGYFGFSTILADYPLRSRSRAKGVAYPRQLAMYLARKLLPGLSLDEIGHHFGDRDHTTVMHACSLIEKHLSDEKTSVKTRGFIEKICSLLNAKLPV
jgi:chromosomal replication initiator protein